MDNVQNVPRSNLALALETARSALLAYNLAIDATSLNEGITGTQVLTLELIGAMAKNNQHNTKLSIILSDHVPRKVLNGLETQVTEVYRMADLKNQIKVHFDAVYRPFQVYQLEELEFLRKIATRVIVAQLDFIAFSNPSYFGSWEEWQTLRHLTQSVLAGADGVTYLSEEGKQDAKFQGFVLPEELQCVTYQP